MRYLFSLVFLCLIAFSVNAQVINKAATDAFTITRMAEKFHVQPRPVDKSLSADWFDQLVKELDEDKIFFTREDMDKLLAYRLQLDNELSGKKTGFLQLLLTTYQQRIQQADTMIDNLCRQAFQFNSNEKFTIAEDTAWAANTAALRKKINKHLKAAILNKLLEWDALQPSMAAAQKKKKTDSIEIVFRKKMQSGLKRAISRMLQTPGGIQQEVCTAYCQSLAVCYDPHSAFFPPTEKENFESALGNNPLQFGFNLAESDDGAVTINNLKPGSPAFKSGQLNKGDKIQSIQWEGQEPIDVSGAGPDEINAMLDAANHTKLLLTVKKADGTLSKVGLAKEKAAGGEEEDRVKSFLLKGSKTIGYISLPAFYTDWGGSETPINGCADDVAMEIVKLKKENIAGLVLDLRYNGGGSMQEATDLAGIFIDAGPVAQVKSRDPKVFTMKDANRGSIYDGPLLLLVNGYSASASEMVAGTLQDYNRALIAGSATYGKATAQMVLPMDTTIDLNGDIQNRKADSYLKLTIDKLYRVTGNSAQAKGVIPDILLPDMLDVDPHREVNEHFAFAFSAIEPNRYYKPNMPLPLASIQAFAKQVTDTSASFTLMKQYIQDYKKHLLPKDLPLSWTAAAEERKLDKLYAATPPDFNTTQLYLVANHAYEERRLKTDEELKKLDDSWKTRLLKDPAVQVAFLLLTAAFK